MKARGEAGKRLQGSTEDTSESESGSGQESESGARPQNSDQKIIIFIHTEGNVTQIRRKLRDAEKIQMIFAHQVVAAHCQHEPAIENLLNIT